MIDKLEAFRERLAAPRKERQQVKWREHAGFVLSIAAFLISGGSTYYNLVREVDDISVLVSSPSVGIPGDASGFELWGSLTLAFVNGGNRTAVISDVLLNIYQKTSSELINAEGRVCVYGNEDALIVGTDAKNVLLKKEDVVSTSVSLKALSDHPHYLKEDDLGRFKIEFTDEHRRHRNAPFVVCAMFYVITPSGGSWQGVELIHVAVHTSSVTILSDIYEERSKVRPLLHQRVR